MRKTAATFEDLFSGERTRALRFARRIVGEPEAEDTVQAALLLAWMHWNDYRGDKATRETWFRRILLNACLDVLRKRRVRPTVSIEDVADARTNEHWEPAIRSHEAPIVARLTVACVRRRLPWRHQLALDELVEHAAGGRFDDNGPTQKVRRHRARATLKRLLAPIPRGQL